MSLYSLLVELVNYKQYHAIEFFLTMTEQPRKRSRKWDVPAENFERGSIGSSSTSDAAQKARERAAQLAAKLAAQGKLASSAPPPPIIAPSAIRPPVSIGAAKPASQVSNTGIPEPQIVKLEHGGYMAEFEINDLPARVNLTKKGLQDKIALQSGAAIVTKGRYVPSEEKELLTGKGERPLYLNIQAPIQAKVQVAIHMIKDSIKNFGKPEQPGSQNGNQHLNFVQDKVFVGLDFAPPEYNVKEKLQGPNGSYMQHIIAQTGAKVHLRGKGSGFIEQNSGRESYEALHIFVSHPKPDGLQAAKSLCESLLQSVHADFKVWDQTKRQNSPYQPQAYGQQPYQQPPTMYPGYNVHPPNLSSQGISMPPSVYPQEQHGNYQSSNYSPATSYPNQPPSSYHAPFEPPYSEPPPQRPLTGYPVPRPASYTSYNDGNSYSKQLPMPDTYQASSQSSRMSDPERPRHDVSQLQPAQAQRKRRRFTEDPELIRKATEPTLSKESPSHSLDSNTKFRSSGEPTKGMQRDQVASDFANSERGTNFLPPPNPSSFKDVFKPPSILPSGAPKTKKKTPKPNNALSSLLAYEESDSEEES